VVNTFSEDSIEKKQSTFSPKLFHALSVGWCSHSSYITYKRQNPVTQKVLLSP